MQNRKPGILVLNGCLPPPYGGIARYLSRMLPRLTAQGYRVWAAMPRDYSDYDYASYQAQGIQIVMPRANRGWNLPPLLLRYAPEWWERVMRYHLPAKEALLALNDWLPELDNLLAQQRDQVDIIHVYDAPWRQGWIGRILARRYHKRLVMTTYGEVAPHDNPLALVDSESYRYRDFCAAVVHDADLLASMTAYCAAKLEFVGVPPDRVRRQHHIVGMEEFVTPPASTEPLLTLYPVLRDRRLILFVGQLIARKGPNLIVEIARHVLAQHPDCIFAFVGPNLGMRQELETLAQRHGISEHCLFTGAVTDEELRLFYHRATVFLFTTVAQIECLGLTFVQAMYAKCPVIAADISGVPEVINPGVNGLLFAPGDHAALQAHLLALLDDPALAQRLAAQAFADVTGAFSEETALAQLEAIYREVL